ncbi:hypothetical protein [Prevotella sp. tc2-28]|uniref:hypothetical protein n=1 Tax=Prevotella sp. tc2-28 TaxID=1761888 RepID=UPI0015A48C93|nr:hypothetical protein [Prevotella sp. tc2-28]
MAKKGDVLNPKGRPRNTIRTMIKEFEDAGLVVPSNEEMGKMYLYIATLNEEELKKLLNDKELPMMTRIIARGILSKKGLDVVDKIVNRAYGSQQHIDITTNGKDLQPEPMKLIFVANKEELEKIENEIPNTEEKEGK